MIPLPSLTLVTKLAGAAALAAIVTLAALWQMSEGRADRLYDEIHAEGTGYAARLGVCNRSVAGLRASLRNQNDAVAEAAQRGETAQRETGAALDAAAPAITAARDSAQRVRVFVPTTPDRCAQFDEADALIDDELTRLIEMDIQP
jgi:hypothetical protein